MNEYDDNRALQMSILQASIEKFKAETELLRAKTQLVDVVKVVIAGSALVGFVGFGIWVVG